MKATCSIMECLKARLGDKAIGEGSTESYVVFPLYPKARCTRWKNRFSLFQLPGVKERTIIIVMSQSFTRKTL